MSLYNNIINKILTFVLSNTFKKTDDEIEILRYGIEVIVMNISKLFIIYLIAFILGYLLEAIFVTIILGFIRSFASGLHVKGFLKCTLFSSVIFTFIIAINSYLNIALFMKVIISFSLVLFIYKYSPADTEEKPYFDEENRKKLKKNAAIVSIAYAFIWLTSILGVYSNYFASTLIAQLVLIHPLTYKVLGRRYNNYLFEDEYM